MIITSFVVPYVYGLNFTSSTSYPTMGKKKKKKKKKEKQILIFWWLSLTKAEICSIYKVQIDGKVFSTLKGHEKIAYIGLCLA